MKKLLLLSMLISLPAQAVDWDAHPYDKYSHIAIGGAISCAVTKYTGNPWYGLLSGIVVGAIKESTDLHFDRADLASWAVGGAVGAVCINF